MAARLWWLASMMGAVVFSVPGVSVALGPDAPESGQTDIPLNQELEPPPPPGPYPPASSQPYPSPGMGYPYAEPGQGSDPGSGWQQPRHPYPAPYPADRNQDGVR